MLDMVSGVLCLGGMLMVEKVFVMLLLLRLCIIFCNFGGVVWIRLLLFLLYRICWMFCVSCGYWIFFLLVLMCGLLVSMMCCVCCCCYSNLVVLICVWIWCCWLFSCNDCMVIGLFWWLSVVSVCLVFVFCIWLNIWCMILFVWWFLKIWWLIVMFVVRV